MKPKQTKSKQIKTSRNAKIKWDFDTQMSIYGSQRMAVAEYLAGKYKVSVATVLRCS